jgi:hypothetical protein
MSDSAATAVCESDSLTDSLTQTSTPHLQGLAILGFYIQVNLRVIPILLKTKLRELCAKCQCYEDNNCQS